MEFNHLMTNQRDNYSLSQQSLSGYLYGRDEPNLFVKQINVTTKSRTNPTKKEPQKVKREPHNTIEKKRRNNINENIRYLGQLLPENMCQGKVSKGTILKGSVLYVKTLKDQLINYKTRLDYLERQVAALNGSLDMHTVPHRK